MRRFIFALLLLGLCSLTMALDIPPLSGRVVDRANLLTGEQQATLDNALANLEETNSSQIFVLIIPTLDGMDIAQYSIKVAEAWKAGQAKLDNGALLVVAVEDRKLRIEVGYGLEDILTDARCDYIIRQMIVPRFRDGDFYGGISNGLSAMIGLVTHEFEITDEQLAKFKHQQQGSRKDHVVPGIVMMVIFGLLMSTRFGRGMLLGMLLSGMMGGGRRGGGFGGGGFGGGGGFSGGGGGGFGGGGASGGW
jgi:uncharacterized protein